MKPEKILSILVAAALFGSSAPFVIAQESDEYLDEIEEIIVTATRREARLQDVPQAISVFTEQMMTDVGATGFNDLVDHIAGIEYRTPQAGKGEIAMRGIAPQGGVPGGPGSPVGLYLDELPLTMAGMFPDIKSFDVKRIEVLRGPQGTLFGEGSMAGTIRLVSNQPDPSGFSGKVDLTYSDTKGGESNKIANLALNIPLGETLALRVSGFYNDMGGFIDLLDYTSGEPLAKNSNSSKTSGGYFVLGWMPTDKLEVSLSALINRAKQGDFNFANEDYMMAASIPSSLDDDLNAYNLAIRYEFGFADFVSSSSWFDRKTNGPIASDGLVPIVSAVYGQFGLPAAGPITGVHIDQDLDSKAFSQELRLVSNGTGSLQWTAGAFYKKQDFSRFFTGGTTPEITAEENLIVSTILTTAILGTPVPMEESILSVNNGSYKQIALFGEVSYDFSDHFQALIGARIFREDRTAVSAYSGLFPFLIGLGAGQIILPDVAESEGRSNVFNPKLTLNYNFESSSMVYGTVSQGFRSGGQNPFAQLLPGAPLDYDPEKLTNFEIGYKSTWADGKLIFNAAAYYMNWRDLQAVVIEGPGGAFEAQDNVGDAHSTGVDLELNWVPIEGLTFAASATLLEAETDDEYVRYNLGGPPTIAPKGSRIPRVAEQSFNLSGQYNWSISGSLGGVARLSYSYVGDSKDILVNPITVESYNIVDARIGIESDRWGVTLFVDNLTDEFITLDKSREEPPTPWVGQYWTVGRPRTIGVNVRFNF